MATKEQNNKMVAIPEEEMSLLLNRIRIDEGLLANAIVSLTTRVDSIEKIVSESKPEVIIVEQMSKEEAKAKVLDFIKKSKTTDIAELHKAIRCDIGLLIQVVDELIKEGRIGE